MQPEEQTSRREMAESTAPPQEAEADHWSSLVRELGVSPTVDPDWDVQKYPSAQVASASPPSKTPKAEVRPKTHSSAGPQTDWTRLASELGSRPVAPLDAPEPFPETPSTSTVVTSSAKAETSFAKVESPSTSRPPSRTEAPPLVAGDSIEPPTQEPTPRPSVESEAPAKRSRWSLWRSPFGATESKKPSVAPGTRSGQDDVKAESPSIPEAAPRAETIPDWRELWQQPGEDAERDPQKVVDQLFGTDSSKTFEEEPPRKYRDDFDNLDEEPEEVRFVPQLGDTTPPRETRREEREPRGRGRRRRRGGRDRGPREKAPPQTANRHHRPGESPRPTAEKGPPRDDFGPSEAEESFDDWKFDAEELVESRPRRGSDTAELATSNREETTLPAAEGPRAEKRRHITTWDEAIGLLIEANLKNRGPHSSSPRRRRGGRRR